MHRVNKDELYKNQTPAQIAKANKHYEIALYLETNEIPSDKVQEPKYTEEELIKAVKRAEHIMLDEFIEEDYHNGKEKLRVCQSLIECAKELV